MLKKLWLRDYDLVSMKKTINDQLVRGETPDDCIIKLGDLAEAINNVKLNGAFLPVEITDAIFESFDLEKGPLIEE